MNRDTTLAAEPTVTVIPVLRAVDPEAGIRRRRAHRLIPLLFMLLLGMLAVASAPAGERKVQIKADHPLSAEEIGNIKQDFRARLRQKLKESAHAGNNQYSVVATANCTEGYVVKAKVTPSAGDVVIVSEEGALCDAQGCQAWQVRAERASEALFDLDIALECTQEDWLTVEQAP